MRNVTNILEVELEALCNCLAFQRALSLFTTDAEPYFHTYANTFYFIFSIFKMYF